MKPENQMTLFEFLKELQTKTLNILEDNHQQQTQRLLDAMQKLKEHEHELNKK